MLLSNASILAMQDGLFNRACAHRLKMAFFLPGGSMLQSASSYRLHLPCRHFMHDALFLSASFPSTNCKETRDAFEHVILSKLQMARWANRETKYPKKKSERQKSLEQTIQEHQIAAKAHIQSKRWASRSRKSQDDSLCDKDIG